MRLRRTDQTKPGYTRRVRGRGVSFLDNDRRPLRDPAELRRLRELAIPPAWRDVWICPDPRGHLQATGIDAAGRKQYLYHPRWRDDRDKAKYAHVLAVARRLPAVRRRVSRDLAGRGLTRSRVLAAVVRLLDLGMFRVGGDEYATGDDPTYGVTTLRPEHVRGRSGCVVLEFTGKGGIEQVRRITDPEVCRVLRDLRRRRRDADRLFGYWEGRRWHDVHADDVNDYLRGSCGVAMTAKDFRTWHATLRTCRRLAETEPSRSSARRRRVVAEVMREVAELLGNTPAVARASYVDPRIIDRYLDGRTADIAPAASRTAAERAVIDFLSA
ncbi:DNA topoisomerase IB [Micromonospora pisi]|uniref:DNA topoisomerase n=1 Tax=Micromonospora pisi TaxID=589240 RepID=A0A495JBA7_9ACTN|nr:DNA topoisomerase IB [Micromonospora pisi]RKR86217.1 DNA topoisomerase IB [Micromonospora pisi]